MMRINAISPAVIIGLADCRIGHVSHLRAELNGNGQQLHHDLSMISELFSLVPDSSGLHIQRGTGWAVICDLSASCVLLEAVDPRNQANTKAACGFAQCHKKPCGLCTTHLLILSCPSTFNTPLLPTSSAPRLLKFNSIPTLWHSLLQFSAGKAPYICGALLVSSETVKMAMAEEITEEMLKKSWTPSPLDLVVTKYLGGRRWPAEARFTWQVNPPSAHLTNPLSHNSLITLKLISLVQRIYSTQSVISHGIMGPLRYLIKIIQVGIPGTLPA
ncbi:hypothetical protein FB45DRAFT_1149654 [Roridomyces roridus]|uniref:Uncharacterized protein n=1 Tax=Roridomyces roridus TaxID=1738132 RepID=A0AAD7F6H7_9AGAR|nr:hypothetical protein FB45DRAFT_1149654 [Roridomyces roridus]